MHLIKRLIPDQVLKFTSSSTRHFGSFRKPCHSIVSDRLMVSHTTCRSHRRFLLKSPRVSTFSVRHFLLSGLCFSHSSDSSSSCVRYAVLMSNASSASIIIPSILFSTLIGMGSKTLTTRTMQEFCRVSQECFLVRCVRRDPTFVHSPVERATANFSPALRRIELSGFYGSPTQNNQDLLIPRIAATKSSRHSPQCATWCQQKELICLLVFASKHSL